MSYTSSSMRTGTGRRQSSRGGHGTGRNLGYIEGSAVRKQYEERRQLQERNRKTRQRNVKTVVKAAPMNMGYIAVMVAAFVVVCCVLMSYIKLQSDITSHITKISNLERQLNEKKLENDETYTKIMSSIDLEEIKRIAVNELGMKYAKEGQVVQYTREGNDYVQQYRDIPE